MTRYAALPLAALALLLPSGAAGLQGDAFTASISPVLVQPGTHTYTVQLTNAATSQSSAHRARVGIPTGFTVSEVTVSAAATGAGACTGGVWEADGALLAGDAINLRSPAATTNEVCPGATLSVTFSAQAATEGAHTWTTELFSPTETFPAPTTQPSVTVDGTAPETTIGAPGPSGSVSSTTESFAFSSSEQDSTFECSVDGGDFADCTSPQALTALADGPHSFAVQATDPAGNVDPSPDTRAWTVDTGAPDTAIESGPSGPTPSTSATFELTSPDDPLATFECSLDGELFAACTSPREYTGLTQGSHTLEVRAVDAAGNRDPAPASRTWTVDTVAPQTSVDSGPEGPTSSLAASFGFSADESSTFECRIDDDAFQSCESPQGYAGLSQGSHTFEVRAIDLATNLDLSPASRSWIVDTTAPETTITDQPEDPTNDTSPSFSFGSSQGNSSFQCRLDAGALQPCTSPHGYVDVAPGAHTFEVFATDAAGNADDTPASFAWVIDTTPPATSVDGPSGLVNVRDATLSFSSEAGATFECRLGAAAFAACSSPSEYTGLDDGSHTFQVRATDEAGNVEDPAAARTWTIDATAPDTAIGPAPPALTSSRSASIAFSSEPSADFECKVDSDAYADCTSPLLLSGLADGPHTVLVRATDVAGNTDASPASHAWTVDATPPVTTIGSRPNDPTNLTDASFTFTADESATFDCSIEGGAYETCTSPKQYTGLAEGTHTFSVRATDPAGNTGAADTDTWTVDVTAPQTTIDSTHPIRTNQDTISFIFSASEPRSSFECSLDGTSPTTCQSPALYDELDPGTHTFEVWATDEAGNADATSAAHAWTIDVTAPETSIIDGPADPTNQTSATFQLAAEAGATFECSLDGGAWLSCPASTTYPDLGDGAHTFAARATDDVGNTDASPATWDWTIDTGEPETAIDGGPQGPTPSSSAGFAFSSEPGASFECSLDGAVFAPCVSPAGYTGLSEGAHTFQVRARDPLGNTDQTPSERLWTVDTIAPDTTVDGPSGTVTRRGATFTFASEAGAGFRCSLDGGRVRALHVAGLAHARPRRAHLPGEGRRRRGQRGSDARDPQP